MLEFVIDASTALPFVLQENGSSDAARLIGLARANVVELHAPELIWTECAHAWLKATRRRVFREAEACRACELLRALPITVHSGCLLEVADFEQAAREVVGAYDAVYLALARRLGLPLITEDAKMTANAGTAHTVMSLAQATQQLESGRA